MKRYRLSVCKGSDCRDNGSDAVYAKAVEQVGVLGLAWRCEVYRGGCYGLCHLGANVVVREDAGGERDPFASEDFQLLGGASETYYWAMTPDKMVRVVGAHIGEGEKVKELVGDPAREADFRKRG